MSPKKYAFYYGHRRPSQNRPVVRGGLFTNRRPISPALNPKPKPTPLNTDYRQWDPHSPTPPTPSPLPSSVPLSSRRLSPLARSVLDSLLRHRRWCPALVSDLSKLHRLTPHLLTSILRHSLLPPPLYSRLLHFATKQKYFNPTFSLFNSLAYSLHRSNLPRAADQVPELMSSLGKFPTEKQLEILVRFHSDAGRGLRVHHIYKKMRSKFHIRPRIFLYNRILDALIKTDHLDLALSVHQDLLSDGLKEEPITFTILAKGLCKAGQVDEAVRMLARMREKACRPDVFAYTAMVKVLAAKGDLGGCLRVWEEMARDGVQPDVMAYTTMVSGLCRVGRVERGEELFREMKGKGFLIDRSVYGALVEGFVRCGKVQEGCGILKEMVKDGYRPDLGIYNCLIAGLCEYGRVDRACKIFQIAVSEGLNPGFETVTPLLTAYADSGNMDRLFWLVGSIGKLGLPVMDHLSNFFVNFVKNGERTAKAMELFKDLKGKGYCSVAVYNILLEALHKSGEGSRAVLLFEEMKSSRELEVDSCTYSLVISCYESVGDVREACSCYNKMKEMSWAPSIAAYCSLVAGLCKIGEINPAITLVKDCLGNVTDGPMEFKYTLTILNACRSRDPEKVIQVLDEMMEEGYHLEDIIYCAVIHGFCKHASSEEARKVLTVMKNRNLLSESRFIVYEEMLDEHLKKVTAGLVISGLKFFGLESKLKLRSNED